MDELLRGRAAAPRRWIRWSAIARYAVALALVGVVAASLSPCVRGQRRCATVVRTQPDDVSVLVCQREYEDTGDPFTGALLADALRRSSDRTGATAVATALLATPARGDALYVLGRIANAERRVDAAISLLEEARRAHRDQGRRAALAKDNQALAGVFAFNDRPAEGLRMLAECIAEASAAGDTIVAGYCHTSSAVALAQIGNFNEADRALTKAGALRTTDRDLAELESTRGNLYQERDRYLMHGSHHELAILAFERAVMYGTLARRTDLVRSGHQNLAFSYAEAGKPAQAMAHLALAEALDLKHDDDLARAQIAARISYRRGDLSLAWSQNEQIYQRLESADERFDVCTMQTEIALARDDLDGAERWARRGIEQTEAIRADQPVEMRPWALSSRRTPYELLFVTLVRAGRLDDALLVFDTWQGRTLLDKMALPSPRLVDLRAAADRVDDLHDLLPKAEQSPVAGPGDRRAVLATLRTTDLLALALAAGDVWSITASSGRLAVRNLGRYKRLKDQLDEFMARPLGDARRAEQLGELILGEAGFRSTRDPLYVVLDGPLAQLPISALRRGGIPLIKMRPVVRGVRLPAVGCIPGTSPSHATVLADVGGDLPDGRREAEQVAQRFGTSSFSGAAATSHVLRSARRDGLFHAAVHANVDVGGGVLMLHDRKVSALEISANKLGAGLVVLSACMSADAIDLERAGSLATAFLAGGANHVVATLRPVSDKGAAEVMTEFYRTGGVTDPVRSLARSQASLADGGNADWPSFVVFGHDVCSPKP